MGGIDVTYALGATGVKFTFLFVDDTGLPVTGLTYATIPTVYWTLDSVGTVNTLSIPNGNITELNGGRYSVVASNAMFTTAGQVEAWAEASGKRLVFPKFQVGGDATILDILQGDESIDTGVTPWNRVVKLKGTSTELIRKKLRDVTGATVTSTTTVIGSAKES